MSSVTAWLFWSTDSDPILWTFQPAIFFGLYCASFVHCVRWLLFEDEGWRIRKKINWWSATTALLVFLLSTTLFFALAMTTFGIDRGSIPTYWAPATLSSGAIQWSILMVIDSVMIYRCWVVFSKNKSTICFPVVLWCFSFMCEFHSFYCYIVEDSLPETRFTKQVCFSGYSSWTPLAFYVCNIVINIYTTSALVYKIWHAAKNNASTNRLYRICRILAESGILYTLSSLIYLISWIILYSESTSSAPPGQDGQMAVLSPPDLATTLYTVPFGSQIALGISMFIPGIAFNLVIIRIGEQRKKGEDTWVYSKDASKDLLPSELLNHPTQEDMGENSHESMDERLEVMEIKETEAGEIMEVELEGQS